MIQIINVNFTDTNLLSEICKELIRKEIIPIQCYKSESNWISSLKNKQQPEIKNVEPKLVNINGFETIEIDNKDDYIVQLYLIDNINVIDNSIRLLQAENANYKTILTIGVTTKDFNRVNQIDTLFKTKANDIQRLITNLLYLITNYSTDLRNYDFSDIADLLRNRSFVYNWKQFETENIKEQIKSFQLQYNENKTPAILFVKGIELGTENFSDIIENFYNDKKPDNMLWKVLQGNEFEINTLTQNDMDFITNELIEKEVIELWTEYRDKEFCKYNPLAPEKIKKGGLLFIGLNPSIRKEAELMEFNNKLENYGFPPKTDNYFGKFWKIAEQTGFIDNWSHFDLLFLRGDQKFVEKIQKDIDNEGHIFIWKQLQISKKLLENAKPELIVISNKLAVEFTGKNKIEKNSEVFGEWMNCKFEQNGKNFTLNGIPVIFSKQPNRFFSNSEMEELINEIVEIKTNYNID